LLDSSDLAIGGPGLTQLYESATFRLAYGGELNEAMAHARRMSIARTAISGGFRRFVDSRRHVEVLML
jgi:hypothetical protein